MTTQSVVEDFERRLVQLDIWLHEARGSVRDFKRAAEWQPPLAEDPYDDGFPAGTRGNEAKP